MQLQKPMKSEFQLPVLLFSIIFDLPFTFLDLIYPNKYVYVYLEKGRLI